MISVAGREVLAVVGRRLLCKGERGLTVVVYHVIVRLFPARDATHDERNDD